MKMGILFLCMVFSGLHSIAQPQLHFDKNVYDLGQLPESGIVHREISFVNTGDAPLLIRRLWGSDGGMMFSHYRGKVYRPGDTGKITISYITKNRVGPVTRHMRITDNNDSVHVIKVTGRVVKGLPDPTIEVK